jgi:hypothetical protein
MVLSPVRCSLVVMKEELEWPDHAFVFKIATRKLISFNCACGSN